MRFASLQPKTFFSLVVDKRKFVFTQPDKIAKMRFMLHQPNDIRQIQLQFL